MGEVIVQLRKDDPEALVILASGVPSSPVKRPTFRVRNLRTKFYAAPSGFQSDVYEFSWDVTREEDALKFCGSFKAFRWLNTNDPLALEIPAVGYSARINFPHESAEPVELEKSPTSLEVSAGSTERPLPEDSRGVEPSERSFDGRRRLAIALAALAVIAAAFAGWQLFQISALRDALQITKQNYEQANVALEQANVARQTEQRAAAEASAKVVSEIEKFKNLLAASKQETSAALKRVDDISFELQQERAAHKTSRERLASAQRELDAETARRDARASSPLIPPQAPADPPAAVPQRQSVPIQVTPSRPQTTLTPSSGAFSDSTKFSLPSETLHNLVTPPPVPTTDCDILAANPSDPRRVGVGVKFSELRRNAAAAVEACDRALAANPKEPRFLYQKARALYAAGDLGARAIFDQLLTLGYPSAFDNAAQYMLREGNNQDAEALFRRGVELEDPDAMVSLADGIRAGRFSPRTAGEDFMLYGRAAKLGHQGAKNTVEQWQSINGILTETSNQLRRAIGR